MSKQHRSTSIRHEILTKLHLHEIEGNPILPLTKFTKRPSQKPSQNLRATIDQQEILSLKSIKVIKPYKTEKTIRIETNEEYAISSILQSAQYKKLQSKLLGMMGRWDQQKAKLGRDIKKVDKAIIEETQRTEKLMGRLVGLDRGFQRLESEYYERRRQNYELRAEVSARRERSSSGVGQAWNRQLIHNPNNRQLLLPQPHHQQIDLDNMTYQQILQLQQRLGKQSIGLRTETIAKLKVEKLETILPSIEVTCCICCQTIERDHNIIQLQCQHVHHDECIKQWLKIKRLCPLCKGEVKIE